MTREEKTDQIIYDRNISVTSGPLRTLRGMYYRDSRGKVIVLDSSLTDRQRLETKAHELGHDKYTRIDLISAPAEIRRIEEARIRRWEIEYLMPVRTLIEAFRLGYTSPLELSDFLEITCEKLVEGFRLYYDVYGRESIHGQHIVTWQPFSVKTDKRRRPEDPGRCPGLLNAPP